MLPEFGGDTYAGADNFMNGRANGVVDLPLYFQTPVIT